MIDVCRRERQGVGGVVARWQEVLPDGVDVEGAHSRIEADLGRGGWSTRSHRGVSSGEASAGRLGQEDVRLSSAEATAFRACLGRNLLQTLEDGEGLGVELHHRIGRSVSKHADAKLEGGTNRDEMGGNAVPASYENSSVALEGGRDLGRLRRDDRVKVLELEKEHTDLSSARGRGVGAS